MNGRRGEQHEAVLEVLGQAVDQALVRAPAVGLKLGDLLAGALELGAQLLARELTGALWLVLPCPSADVLFQ